MECGYRSGSLLIGDLLQRRLGRTGPPCPGVAKPQRRQNVHGGGIRAAIGQADLDEDVFRRLLRIFHKDVEITILVENAGIEQLVLHVAAVAPTVGFGQIVVGKCRMRILVQILHIRMRRRAVEVEVVFFDIFAVVALAVRQTEEAFLEDWITAIPQGHTEAERLLVVADAGKTVFPPG